MPRASGLPAVTICRAKAMKAHTPLRATGCGDWLRRLDAATGCGDWLRRLAGIGSATCCVQAAYWLRTGCIQAASWRRFRAQRPLKAGLPQSPRSAARPSQPPHTSTLHVHALPSCPSRAIPSPWRCCHGPVPGVHAGTRCGRTGGAEAASRRQPGAGTPAAAPRQPAATRASCAARATARGAS
jgi:hypothetical protein